MIKKSISFIIVAAVLVSLFPVSAFAAEGTIDADGTYDIGSYGNNSVITIEDGLTVTLTNTGGLTLTNVQINCGYGTILTIDGIKIDNSAYDGACALSFTQYNNKLILVGDSYIKSGNNMPGIKEDSSSELEISGEGSIEVYGGTNAAGIGGIYQSAEMATVISGGTVKATGGFHGAGIGGGDSNQELMVTISEGNVTAQGGEGGAGIGGGYNSTGCVVIEINGGDVNAAGGSGGAGIGGGYNGNGGESYITGDCTVRAYGGQNAAGIGGGQGKHGGILDVSGGLVLAEGNGGYDIGCGAGASPDENDWFKISGNAAVLLRNGTSTEPTMSHHELKVQDTVTDHMAFGYNLPDSWTKAYAYIKTYYDLAYDSNGGEGTLPETVTGHEGTSTAVSGGTGLTREGDVFLKWNTQTDGLGTDYSPGALFEFAADTTLYAIYKTPPNVESITLSHQSATLSRGDNISLTADVQPPDAVYSVVWTSSDESVAVVNSSGLVTAMGGGDAIITAEAGGISATCDIHVNFNITLDAQNGTENVIVKVIKDSAVPEPEAPIREGYTFNGWYTEQGCANEWDFGDAVTSDMTLYAGWTPEGCPFTGRGTEASPYLITSADDLAQLSALVNAGSANYYSGYYLQTQDIDLSAYSNWTPIGAYQTYRSLSGTYDGNGKSITGLSINSQDTYISGLFGYASGNIKNIKLESGTINVKCSDSALVGGIVAYLFADGSVQDCSNSADINVSTVSVRATAGGIVGDMISSGTISGCVNSGDIYSISRDYEAFAGGIAGEINYSTQIMNCANSGYISSHSTFGVDLSGGIAGFSNAYYGLSINTCYNIGRIDAGDMAGGIIGKAYKTSIANCFNAGYISGGAEKGGIAGYGANTSFSVRNCYNMGSIYPSGIYGGIVGRLDQNYAVSDCYYADSCFAGIGSGTSTTYKKTMEQLQQQATYTNFDFGTVWTLDKAAETGYAFPQLRDNTFYALPHSLNLFASNETGTVSSPGTYKFLDWVTITATPKENYRFYSWSVTGGLLEKFSNSPTTSFIMPNSDVTIKAIFESDNVDDFDFVIEGENAVVEKYKGAKAEVRVPTIYKGRRVTAIGDNAFSDNTVLTSVEVPDTIESIGEYAFSYCTNLENIELGNGITSINNRIFWNCQSLNSITIPDSVMEISNWSFYGCVKLKSIAIGAGVESIGSIAFLGCPILTSLIVSRNNEFYASVDGVLYDKQIKKLVRYPAGKLGPYSILQGVTSIGDSAFMDCKLLTGIAIPEGIKTIGELAFCECDNLESVTIPDSVESIGDKAFYLCDALENVLLGKSVESIGEYCFYSCVRLTQIEIPESVTTIGDRAFDACNLYEVYCWGYEPKVGTDAFGENHTYTKAYFHISHPVYWASFSGCAKNIFCLLTLDKKNGEAPETNKALLNYLKLPVPPSPVKAHNTFEHWCADEECRTPWDFGTPVAKDITLYAKWKPVDYTVRFDARGGNPVNTQTAAYGSNITAVPGTERPYYVFSGWYTTPACSTAPVAFPYAVTGDVTLYAGWQPQSYNIYYNLDGGAISAENPSSYTVESSPFTLRNPARTGYTFLGWTGTGLAQPSVGVTVYKGSAGDRWYTACWKVNEYGITFNSKEGSAVLPMTGAYGSVIPEPPPPSRQGYAFAGWYKDSSCKTRWNFGTDRVTGSDTLYAKWQPYSYYLDNVELSAGTLMKPFTKSTVRYNITLGEHESGLMITPVKEYDGAVMKINNAVRESFYVSLASGKSATVKVAVTYNRKTKTYVFKITRAKSSDNSLGTLAASSGTFDKPFDPNILNYTLLLDENTKSVTVSGKASAPAARISPRSKRLTLKNGQRKTVKIAVKAQNGARRTYTITVIRAASADANLKTLKTSPGLSPGFSPHTASYTVTLPAAKGTFSISARPAGYNAAVYIDGARKSSKKVALFSGQSVTVHIMVLAQAGNTKDYYITVTRP